MQKVEVAPPAAPPAPARRVVLARAAPAGAGGQVRPAAEADIPAMKALIDGFARQNRMLFRSAAELREFLDEYLVYVDGDEGGRLLGVCGLHPVAGSLAEVRGLAVAEAAAGRGIGRRLVEACVERARRLGVAKVYTLTLVPGFFEKLGFSQVNKATLHLKVWYECYRCPKFANCDEIAMVRPLDLEPQSSSGAADGLAVGGRPSAVGGPEAPPAAGGA
jgi:amino-acid N-acetyltransferase